MSFSKTVGECEPFKLNDAKCPEDRLVGLGKAIDDSLKIVMDELPKQTKEDHIVYLHWFYLVLLVEAKPRGFSGCSMLSKTIFQTGIKSM